MSLKKIAILSLVCWAFMRLENEGAYRSATLRKLLTGGPVAAVPDDSETIAI